MQFVRPVVRTVGTITGTVRDMSRLRQVASILAKHGLGILVTGIDVPGINSNRSFESTPQRTVLAIQELGPTYIKLGQILSTRPDVIPPAYIEALQALQDDVVSLPFSDITSVLDEELGKDWSTHLDIEEKSLATASIAQVHRARIIESGEEVVLKIQRPHIGSKIRADLSILRFLMERTLNEFPELELFDPRGIFQEFEKSITAELDFFQEVRNLQRFRKNFFHMDGVVWPKPYEEFSSARIMCMGFLNGVKIREARTAGFDMDVVGQRYIRVAYAMLFEHGFFHGDLHPGNVLVLEDNIIGIIDCGMVGRLTDEMKDYLASLIYALHRGDSRTVARLFFDISIKEKRVDYLAFERDAIETAEQHWSGGSFEEMDIGAFLMDLTRGALKYRVHAPPAFTMFFKGVMTTEGLAKSLLPEVDPLGAAQPYVERLIKERWQPERWSDLGVQNIAAYAGIARRLPISITQLLDDLDAQRFRIQVEQHQSSEVFEMRRRHDNTKILLVFATAWGFAAIGSLYFEQASVMGFPILAAIMAITSLFFQAWVLFRVWRSS